MVLGPVVPALLFRLTDVVEQVMLVAAEQVIVGLVLLLSNTVEAEAVQPFTDCVIVTV
jgi:hypothetical protein